MVSGFENETDEEVVLLRRARDGDDAAFAALYRGVAPLARRSAHRIVADAHAADDLVQETFYLVLRAVRSGHGPTDSFVGYVLSTVRRLAYRYSADQSRTVTTDDRTVWERLLDPSARHSAQSDTVSVAWASLPPRWRHVLWLIEVDRYSPTELAGAMSMTPNAVSSLATRARQALRSTYLELQHADR